MENSDSMTKQRLRLVVNNPGLDVGSVETGQDGAVGVGSADCLIPRVEIAEKLQRVASESAFERPEVARAIIRLARAIERGEV